MTEQEKIEQAAKKVCDEMEFIAGISRKPNDQDVIDSFKAGASFYEEKIMPEQLAKAMEWISLKGLYQEIDGRWYDKFGGKVRMVAETTKDLLVLFEKYKHNQDATKESHL